VNVIEIYEGAAVMDLVPFAWLSAAMLLVTAILCLVGMLSKAFKDNLFQTLAMAIGLVGCSSRFAVMVTRTDVPFDWLLVHCALGLFAMGTAWKVVTHTEWYAGIMLNREIVRMAAQRDAEVMLASLREHDHIL
jgi:hypothetical protein